MNAPSNAAAAEGAAVVIVSAQAAGYLHGQNRQRRSIFGEYCIICLQRLSDHQKNDPLQDKIASFMIFNVVRLA